MNQLPSGEVAQTSADEDTAISLTVGSFVIGEIVECGVPPLGEPMQPFATAAENEAPFNEGLVRFLFFNFFYIF